MFCGAKVMKPRSASLAAKVVVGPGLPSITSRGRPSRPCWQTTTGRRSPGLQVLGQQQNAEGEHVRKDVQHDFVAGPLGLIEYLASSRDSAGSNVVVEIADHFVAEIVAIRFDRLAVCLHRTDIEFLEELLARVRALFQQTLVVLIHLGDHAVLLRRVDFQFDRRECRCREAPAEGGEHFLDSGH